MERIAPLFISTTSWKIIQKIDLTAYLHRPTELQQIWENLREKCDHMKDRCSIGHQLMGIRTQLREAEKSASDAAAMLRGQQSKRKKRALISLVGKINRFLFGTLDEDDKEELMKIMEIKSNDTRQLANLLANQTEIIDIKFTKIDSIIEEMQTNIFRMAMENQDLAENEVLRDTLEMLRQHITQFELDTEVLTDAILCAFRGEIHPKLLTLEQIENSAKLAAQTTQDAIFPQLTGPTGFPDLIKASDLTVFFANFSLNYILRVPLLTYDKYTLYKPIPAPVQQNIPNITDLFAYIWPEFAHVAIDSRNETYLPLDMDMMEICKKLSNNFICSKTEPIRQITQDTMCEVKLAVGMEVSDPTSCHIRLQKFTDIYWHRLHAENKWVFSTGKEQIIFISCRQSSGHTETLKGLGILTLYPGCTACTETTRLTASQELGGGTNIHEFAQHTLEMSEILESLNLTNWANSFKTPTNMQTFGKKEEMLPAQKLETGAELKRIIEQSRNLRTYRVLQSHKESAK
jgi:hypothetical protein